MSFKNKINRFKPFLRNAYYNSINPNPDFIQEHLSNNFVYIREGHFHPHYKEWTARRINKILSIFPLEELKNKKILILGDGIGTLGGFFISIGADVTILEGRDFNINISKIRFSKLPGKWKIIKADLNEDFKQYGQFDLIINFGLVEVINDIDNLLNCCVSMSDTIILETLVADSSNPSFIGHRNLDTKGIDNGLKEEVCRPSPFYIENFFTSRGFNFERYFDENLNTDMHKYNWKHKNDESISEHTRRFWVFKKDKKRLRPYPRIKTDNDEEMMRKEEFKTDKFK